MCFSDRAMWLNVIGLTALLTICGLCGFVVYAEYSDCDPLTAERISAADQVSPAKDDLQVVLANVSSGILLGFFDIRKHFLLVLSSLV